MGSAKRAVHSKQTEGTTPRSTLRDFDEVEKAEFLRRKFGQNVWVILFQLRDSAM